MFTKKFLPVLFLFAFIYYGCQKETEIISPPDNEVESETIVGKNPAIVVEWESMIWDLVEFESIFAAPASRIYTLTSISLYESLYRGIPGYVSLSGQLNEMPEMPKPDKTLEYDWQSVAISSTNKVVVEILTQTVGNPNQNNLNLITELYNKQVQRRKNIDSVDTKIVDRSLQFGEELGQAIVDWAYTDGFMDNKDRSYTPPSRDQNPLFWAPTVPNGEAIAPYYHLCRTYTLVSNDQCAVPMGILSSDPAQDTLPGSTVYQQAKEVFDTCGVTGENLSQEEKNIAFFWEDKDGTGRPPGHWVSISNIMIKQLNLTLDEAVKVHLYVGIGIGDAFISAWEAKYRNNFLRPKTYIRDFLGEPTFQPIVSTPLFPEYPSGHSVVSGACSYILTQLLGDNIAFEDSTHDNQPLLRNRNFTSFYDAADEAAWSRLFGGIHYRQAIVNGVVQGRKVGQVVMNTINLTQ